MPSASSTSARSSATRAAASPRRGRARPCRRRAASARATRPRVAPPPCLLAAAKASSTSSWYEAREPPLLELAGHRPGGARPPRRDPRAPPSCPTRTPGCGRRRRPGARAPAPPRPRAQLGERRQSLLVVEEPVRRLELGLDVRLAAGGPTAAASPRAEQQADRLREDRLPGAGLAGDRVEPEAARARPREDQHEVLDAQATEQRSRGSGGRRSSPAASPEGSRSRPRAEPRSPRPPQRVRRGARPTSTATGTSAVRFDDEVATAADDERPRVQRVRRDEGTASASRPQTSTGPPFERL